MRIGIDFDNTIACYEQVFRDVATSKRLLLPSFERSKQDVRDAIRLLPDGESRWTELQADVYGPMIKNAVPFDGVKSFIKTAHRQAHEIVIISHKTTFAAARPKGTNLRKAALQWLKQQGFFEPQMGLTQDDVHFSNTRVEKCKKIDAAGVSVFIDDLVELFAEPTFPSTVKKCLFNAQPSDALLSAEVNAFETWHDLKTELLS